MGSKTKNQLAIASPPTRCKPLDQSKKYRTKVIETVVLMLDFRLKIVQLSMNTGSNNPDTFIQGPNVHSSEANLEPDQCFWVGIGSSAGGLEAIRSMVRELDVNIPAVYVIAQHMAPHHKSLLTEIIGRETELDVVDVTDNLLPQRGTIYITPPNHDVRVENGYVRLIPPSQKPASPKPSVDVLLTSLAQDQKQFAIGIILSGTGSDGAQGITAINEYGGISVVQDEHSCKYPGMPQAAMETGTVDLVLTPEEIGAQLGVLTKLPRDLTSLTPRPLSTDGLAELTRMIYDQTKVDFSNYKTGTVQRRVDRRIVAVGKDSLDAYVEYASQDNNEIQELFQDLLINVTSFFRDAGEFEGLKKHIEKLVESNPGRMQRIWIAGTATGEEAYTIAILFAEAFGGLKNFANATFQIFATDIHLDSIDIARRAYYTETSLMEVPDQYLRDYFDPAPGGYTVKKALREKLVFSLHNVATDPPFLNLDLVSCRNLLIYFQSSLQSQVFERFHYALRDHGYLFLGKSEAVLASQSLFKAIPPEKHLFTQRPGHKRRLRSSQTSSTHLERDTSEYYVQREQSNDSLNEKLDSLITALGPDAIVVNEQLNIVKVYGDLDYFTGLNSTSTLTPSVASLIKKPWSQDIQVAVPGVFRKTKVYEGLTREDPNGREPYSKVLIYPMHDSAANEKFALVVFKLWTGKQSAHASHSQGNSTLSHDQTIEELSRELEISKTNLQTTVEELETSNEELQALNEELQSSNEELQSTNEELETSNEELQSTNEELTTVNDELHVSSQQLNAVNQSMRSVLENVYTPMMVVDRQLNIINASDSAVSSFGIDQMHGEPNITNCHLPQGIPSLPPLIAEAFGTREPVRSNFASDTLNVTTTITPFFNVMDDVLGAIIEVLDNTTTVQQIQQDYKMLLDSMPYFVLVIDDEGSIHHANQNVCALLGQSKAELMGVNFYALLHPELRKSMAATDQSVIATEKAALAISGQVIFADGQKVPLRLTRIPVKSAINNQFQVLLIAEQISESEILDSRFENISKATGLAVWVYSSTQSTVTCSVYLAKLLGRTSHCELTLNEFLDSVHEHDRSLAEGIITGGTTLSYTDEDPATDQVPRKYVRFNNGQGQFHWAVVRSQLKYTAANGDPVVCGSMVRFPEAEQVMNVARQLESQTEVD